MEPDGSRIKIDRVRGLAAAAASLSLVFIGCYWGSCTLSVEVQRFGRYHPHYGYRLFFGFSFSFS